MKIFFTAQRADPGHSSHPFGVGGGRAGRYSHWTTCWLQLLGPCQVWAPLGGVHGRGRPPRPGADLMGCVLLSSLGAELGEVWVAEWDKGASTEPLPPSQAGSGREMSSLPWVELPI